MTQHNLLALTFFDVDLSCQGKEDLSPAQLLEGCSLASACGA